MAPIEVFFGALIIVFGLIGWVRGFLRELGVTLVMMFLLFLLSLLDPVIGNVLGRIAGVVAPSADAEAVNRIGFWVFTLILVAAAFVSYQGETLSFTGRSLAGLQGAALGLVIGLVNGYLIAGSLWYYMDKFQYPVRVLGFASDQLSPLAQSALPLLPMNFLGQPVLLGQSMLLYLSAALIIARVVR